MLALLVGTLVLSNLSLGAWLRRSHAAARTMRARRPKRTRRPRARRSRSSPEPVAIAAALAPPIDAVADYRRRAPRRARTRPVSVDPAAPPRARAAATRIRRRSSTSSRSARTATTSSRIATSSGTSPEQSGPSPEANQRIGEALVETLGHFGVDARISGQISGPRVTRYELQLAPGTKVAKVAALKDDLSYALATTEIRILAPIPGKQAVGVEVPNLSPNIVTLGDIFDDLPAGAQRRSRSGSARTSPATPSGPTSRGCRTS